MERRPVAMTSPKICHILLPNQSSSKRITTSHAIANANERSLVHDTQGRAAMERLSMVVYVRYADGVAIRIFPL